MRVLTVTNMTPDLSTPQRGRWVLDQVEEVRRLGVEVDLFAFPKGRSHYMPATRELRRRLAAENFDLVHAHYGLAGWCAQLAGADPLVVTFHGTDVRHRVVGRMSQRLAKRIDLVAGVSRALFEPEADRPGLPRDVATCAVLPCGPNLERFGQIPRLEARRILGLNPDGRFLFFPTDPARPEKRFDLARQLAERCNAELLTGGGIDPDRMSLWFNAANAVVITSGYEGFGLACIEALACDVPVLSTPVGIAPFALGDIDGCICEEFDIEIWAALANRHLDSAESRIRGSRRAAAFAADRMAERVVCAYREVLGHD